MNAERKRYFFNVRRKTDKRVFSAGDVQMVSFAFENGWPIEKAIGKVNAGHGERWS